jgi:hypothetical protein
VKTLKRNRARGADHALRLHELQADHNRDVIESLRKIQLEMQGLTRHQASIERKQEQLALALIKAATAIGGSDPALEVTRA